MLENALHNAFRRRIPSGNLKVTFATGRTEAYGDGSGPPLALRFQDAGALRAVVLDPVLGVPEMYMQGRLVLEAGDIYDLIALAKANTRAELATPIAALHHLRRSLLASPALKAIGRRRARRNVAHHYDLDERLYRLFLDRDMQFRFPPYESDEPGE